MERTAGKERQSYFEKITIKEIRFSYPIVEMQLFPFITASLLAGQIFIPSQSRIVDKEAPYLTILWTNKIALFFIPLELIKGNL